LCLVVAANLLDLLPNASVSPVLWLMAGALIGRLEPAALPTREATLAPAEARRAAAPGARGSPSSGPSSGPSPGPSPGPIPVPEPAAMAADEGTRYTRFATQHRRGAEGRGSGQGCSGGRGSGRGGAALTQRR
ncbi:MAG: hypothetical protein AAF698_00270, partial [Pseudomonadota bacterium]